MIATTDFISRNFSRFNMLCFGGRLTPPAFSLSRSRHAAGQLRFKRDGTKRGETSPGNYKLCVSTLIDLPEEALADIVLHEMIHYHIAVNHLRDTSPHGVIFRRMMAEINARYGRHVSVSIKGAAVRYGQGDGFSARDGDTPPAGRAGSQGRQLYVLCHAVTADGQNAVSVCARTRVLRLDRTLRLRYRLRSLTWHYSADPFFARYPRSLTPKLYRISAEEAEEHIRKASHPLQLPG